MGEKLIVSDPSVMMGKPVIKGTRITVELILKKLGAGGTIEQILEAHPRLTREGIQAALSFAAKSLRSDVVYSIDEAAGTRKGTSYIDPVKSENRKKSFFVKTASYKTALILRTHLA